ncbi:hypothetical protein BFW38_10165 [Terasakiispira papahanaumokuakeensis]|uniref:RNA polymerase subunit sigma-24 n=1 Tax=Terasakiispira papahanaumokuakeensis TaxID=197479 RepID=A0A1E2VEG8_9GAMM|nr:hypothetical protein BFW38_10165 [Terasakiispira papahanaumokuakeensis]
MAQKDASFVPTSDTVSTQQWLMLYQQHERALIDCAERLLGSRAQAEEVVQDAFLKIWEQRLGDNVREPQRFLFRIVRNLALDRLRRQSLEQRYLQQQLSIEMDTVPAGSSPEEETLGMDMLRQLVMALSELPTRMRRVLILIRLEGRTQRDVAQCLGVSPTLVNFILRDTLAHCRQRLQLPVNRARGQSSQG